MNILMIGQLPKEVGGNYTTGVANVLYELSRIENEKDTVFNFATNLKNKTAVSISKFKNQYIGYDHNIFNGLLDLILHPIRNYRELKHFLLVDHANIVRFWYYRENIKKAIRLVEPDIIHVHSIGLLSSAYFARAEKKIPIVLTCHGIFYGGDSNDIKNRDIYWGNIKFADFFTGLTLESQKEYEHFLGISGSKVKVIPNGVDCSSFYYNQEERCVLRKELGISDDTKILITVASVQPRKGQLEFVRILKDLDVNYQYWIIGDGCDVEGIKDYVRENSLNEKIRLFGYRRTDELRKYYSAADIYAHVSEKEGQALCEIEAFACGLRTIVNEKIKNTIPSLNSNDYYVIDMNNINYSKLTGWIEKPDVERSSKKTLDWHVISDMYSELYNSIYLYCK